MDSGAVIDSLLQPVSVFRVLMGMLSEQNEFNNLTI